MKIKHLLEGTAPKLPGAFKGVEVMTPQQFLAQSGDEPEQDVAESSETEAYKQKLLSSLPQMMRFYEKNLKGWKPSREQMLAAVETGYTVMKHTGDVKQAGKAVMDELNSLHRMSQGQGVAEGLDNTDDILQDLTSAYRTCVKHRDSYTNFGNIQTVYELLRDPLMKGDIAGYEKMHGYVAGKYPDAFDALMDEVSGEQGVAEGSIYKKDQDLSSIPTQELEAFVRKHWFGGVPTYGQGESVKRAIRELHRREKQGVAEGQEHLSRIRKLSGLDEATKLPAQSREFGGQEFQDYMKRIVGTPDLDKEGKPKVDKKGVEKYVSGKTKTDKYKMPYIHRSSVVEYLGPDGQTYDEDKVKQTLAIRPKALLKQNEKMKHSNGELEQFFNVGFAALTGIALDEQTNKLIIVNTCPGAGSCKVDCFAMKGGKIQFKAAWQSDGRILTYLLNDPDGFFNQLSAEISKEEKLGQKGGYTVTIRWHDAGDFFSPEYLDLALKMAEKHPNVKFYAYTKMAAAALGQKPPNFIINWSEGAHTSQEKQVKANDPNLERTKNSRIVPTDLFGDLLAKDAKGNLAKGPEGQWVIVPDKLPELKNRLAKEYGLSPSSILGYDEWAAKTQGGKKETPVKYNVIIAPGEPDLTANSHGVLSTLLLRH